MASVTLGRFRGVPLRLHWSFLLAFPVFAWIFSTGASEGSVAWAWGALLAAGLFASVLVHEMAHTAVALRRGIGVASVTLYPIGGVSAFESAPRTWRDELWTTLVGPLSNFVLAALLAPVAWLLAGSVAGAFAGRLALVNVVLGGFNLLVPAFPMDGGRILRAALTRPLGRAKATRTAAVVGRVLAVAMGVAGAFTGAWLLLVIAFVVYGGAAAEERMVLLEEALRDRRASDLAVVVPSLAEGASLADALASLEGSGRLRLPVVDAEGRATGVPALDDVARVAPERRETSRVADIERRDVPRVAPGASAAEALRALAGSRLGIALVVGDDGAPQGVLTEREAARVARFAQARGAP